MKTDTNEVIGRAILSSDLTNGPPFKVHGVAIGVNDVTVGESRIKKIWPGDTLRKAAETLAGKPIVKNHINQDVDAVVGAITKARFEEGVGVVFEGEVDDRNLAEKIMRERLEVSPMIAHESVDDMELNSDGARVVGKIHEFINLSLVTRGAAGSNQINFGESALLTEAALRRMFDYEYDSVSSASPQIDSGEELADSEGEDTSEPEEAVVADSGDDEEPEEELSEPDEEVEEVENTDEELEDNESNSDDIPEEVQELLSIPSYSVGRKKEKAQDDWDLGNIPTYKVEK